MIAQIWKHPNQSGYIIMEDGYPKSIPDDDPRKDEIALYIKENPDIVVPQPTPMLMAPEDTKASIEAQIAYLDSQSIPLIRRMLVGNSPVVDSQMMTAEQSIDDPAAQLADIESQVQSLNEQLAALEE